METLRDLLEEGKEVHVIGRWGDEWDYSSVDDYDDYEYMDAPCIVEEETETTATIRIRD